MLSLLRSGTLSGYFHGGMVSGDLTIAANQSTPVSKNGRIKVVGAIPGLETGEVKLMDVT